MSGHELPVHGRFRGPWLLQCGIIPASARAESALRLAAGCKPTHRHAYVEYGLWVGGIFESDIFEFTDLTESRLLRC